MFQGSSLADCRKRKCGSALLDWSRIRLDWLKFAGTVFLQNFKIGPSSWKHLRFHLNFFTYKRETLTTFFKLVRTYVFHMLRTYVMILCNWLIFWQNALYLYLGRLRICLTTSRNHVLRSSVEAFKSVQEIKQGVQNH